MKKAVGEESQPAEIPRLSIGFLLSAAANRYRQSPIAGQNLVQRTENGFFAQFAPVCQHCLPEGTLWLRVGSCFGLTTQLADSCWATAGILVQNVHLKKIEIQKKVPFTAAILARAVGLGCRNSLVFIWISSTSSYVISVF